ncbi:hypothetical protein [Teichococcus vastitatis]|uniref:Uncharacterized protein n=1 Tax=Teichococcus vastitatis TaxID=2307076 RepID=A0ABS9W5N1_9PROT|nr:hypothetical protein [Pseudoroseomonas vastitatis]MCI0754532.1 hypothetical protein [Pseudoroseomonas vastitatis]
MTDRDPDLLRLLLRVALLRRNRRQGAVGLLGWRTDLFRVMQGLQNGAASGLSGRHAMVDSRTASP